MLKRGSPLEGKRELAAKCRGTRYSHLLEGDVVLKERKKGKGAPPPGFETKKNARGKELKKPRRIPFKFAKGGQPSLSRQSGGDSFLVGGGGELSYSKGK